MFRPKIKLDVFFARTAGDEPRRMIGREHVDDDDIDNVTGHRRLYVTSFLWRDNLAIICGILRRFTAFTAFTVFSGIFQHFPAFSGTLAISFRCWTKYLGGLKPPPPFLVG